MRSVTSDFKYMQVSGQNENRKENIIRKMGFSQ